jgi:predicted permease
MNAVWNDVRFGLRLLQHNPGFAFVAVLTLALGIGFNTAIFTLIDAVMFKTLPVSHPDELVLFQWTTSGRLAGLFKNHFEWAGCPQADGAQSNCSFSYEVFRAMYEHSAGFSGLFANAGPYEMSVMVNGRAHLGDAALVSGDYFPTLGIQPTLGRTLRPEDDESGSPVAVVSYNEWRKRFGGNPAIVGQTITVGNLPVTIVGVAPPDFFGLQPGYGYDLWLPLHLLPRLKLSWFGGFSLSESRSWWLQVAGRQKPGMSAAEAIAQADAVFQRSFAASLGSSKNVEIPRLRTVSVARGLDSLRHQFSKPLGALMALVGLVLLIACANVAGLLLTRATGREREMSVRVALGARPAQLTRQLLVESLLLSALGGAAGWVLSLWGTDLLEAFVGGGDTFQILGVGPDWRVLGFTLAVTLVAGLLAGLAPAVRAGGTEVTPALKGGLFAGGRPHGRSRLSLGLGKGLVVAQVALALLVICAAGLFARTLVNLESVRLGFNERNLLLFKIAPELSAYTGDQSRDLYKKAQQKLAALPGVTSVSWSSFPLIGNWRFDTDVKLAGREFSNIQLLWVGPRFFETMGIPVLSGRDVSLQDDHGSPIVTVVNQAFAREVGESHPIGLQLTGDFSDSKNSEIVGMVADAKYSSLRERPKPTLYLAELQGGIPGVTFEIRTATDPKALVPVVRQTLARLAPDVPLAEVKTQTDLIGESVSTQRDVARLAGLFAFLALGLACIGLYGLVAYSVARRTGEIGLRMALGAAREEVLKMVLGTGAKLAVAGIAIGVALSLALTRLIAGMLYGVGGSDPLTLALASLLLAAVTLLACYIPARRAMRIDPSTALRYE